ncbi:MAG: hypothetical protein M4579_003670 [Chaenotheca gracillima]|nr:MAG: hypothetical protein M4579_003670 [Chaenotheca gracillima]
MNQTASAGNGGGGQSSSWSQHTGPHEPSTTSPMAEEDFSSFLDLGEFTLNFPAFDQADETDHAAQSGSGAAGQHETVPVTDAMDFDYGNVQQQHPHDQSAAVQQRDDLHLDTNGNSGALAHGSIPSGMMHSLGQHSPKRPFEIDMDTQLFQEYYERQTRDPGYQSHHVIPPTPNSIEMQGGAARYYHQLDTHQQQQILADRYQRRKDEQPIFTPLVSPAVTPIDAQFALPEYAVPGSYWSPLTSPALEAQNAASRRSTYGSARSNLSTAATSPAELLGDVASSSTSQSGPPKKSRRKLSNARAPPARVVRQSPSMKPQRKKAGSTSSSAATTAKLPPAMDLPEVMEGQQASEPRSKNLLVARAAASNSQESSSADSVSPEPLSESLMGPPPAPRSATSSGQILPVATLENTAPQNGDTNSSNAPHPATPASLMRLRKGSGANETQPRQPPIGLSPVLSANPEDQLTPTLAAKKTPNLRPLGPAAISPAFSEIGSPSGSIINNSKPSSAGRGGKKRNSTTSVQASPALRPRISPSIKPLLPDGASVSAETSALLLASKSNYQNILEGNHLPGVSYPEALSSNLTSKRTSHKLAEQGRRNRINTALQEMAGLLPQMSPAGPVGMPGPDEKPNGNGKGDGSASGSVDGGAAAAAAAAAAQNTSSKASTVEMAIDYIKDLQNQLAETRGRLDLAEQKLKDRGTEGG